MHLTAARLLRAGTRPRSPSRSSSATVARPASGKSVSLKHVMNSATRTASRAVCHAGALVADRTTRVARRQRPNLGRLRMYQQVYDPVGDSLGLTAIFAVLPLDHAVRPARRPEVERALGGAVLARRRDRRSRSPSTRCRSARRSNGALLGAVFGLFPIMWIVWNAIWIYNMTEATGPLRGAPAIVRADLGRPARPGRDHRLLLRRAARGARRLRHAGRHHRRDADRARLPADQGRRGRARREHRPGRVRRDRDPDHHARRDHRPAQGGPRRDGRPPDADPRALRAAHPRRHGRRHARRAPGVARRHRRRLRLRRRPVRHARTTSPSS